ncbi:MBL fold metallo-hydrolase [Candidatus Nomurabacteria bacterium]|nr:MBL fold metallo-hydrolase [Candidatus Nomurabacteria bacterium]USN94756.1 MAG: MBL fold metallo-hydrolase [Candidatus Nomurabacteria bacterium]
MTNLTKETKSALIFLAFLGAVIYFVYFYVFSTTKTNAESSDILEISFLDIGQGDAIYIEAPNGNQMLVDVGPSSNIASPLKKVIPAFDDYIDVVVLTNPDADHIAGLSYILDNYNVGLVVEPGTKSDTKTYKDLREKINEKHVKYIVANSSTDIILDKESGVYFDVIFPDRDVSYWERNDGSLVGVLKYKDVDVLFTGDATLKTEDIFLKNENLEGVDILKVGHHGSRTSTGVSLLREITPEIAVISSGKNNRYGHPHQEVIDRLNDFEVETLLTAKLGTITILSDGHTLDIK